MKQTSTLFALLFCFTLTSKAQQSALPYYDDFESGAPGWTPYVSVPCGTNWELGTPSTGFIIGAHSGTNCWDVNLNGVYSNYAQCFLSSPIFDFTYVAQAHISFWTKYHTEYLWDYMSVQFSVDKGDSWEYMPFPGLINPDGYVEKWIKSELHVNDLYGYSAVQFRFVFVSDNSIAYDGYSIDDFQIEIDALSAPEINSENDFTFYPNPSNGDVQLNLSKILNKDAALTIYNIQGQQVWKQLINAIPENGQLNLPLPNGIYNLVLETPTSSVTKQLVIIK